MDAIAEVVIHESETCTVIEQAKWLNSFGIEDDS